MNFTIPTGGGGMQAAGAGGPNIIIQGGELVLDGAAAGNGVVGVGASLVVGGSGGNFDFDEELLKYVQGWGNSGDRVYPHAYNWEIVSVSGPERLVNTDDAGATQRYYVTIRGYHMDRENTLFEGTQTYSVNFNPNTESFSSMHISSGR
jgi:hypothetical protein